MALKGEKVILVRRETSPEDVGGMFVAQGIVTATGGKTSHAAVVAREAGASAASLDASNSILITNRKRRKQATEPFAKAIGSHSTATRERSMKVK